jgi:peroxiredoxin
MYKFFFILALFFQTSMLWAQGYELGAAVADFDLMNVNGKKVQLSKFLKKHKGVVIIFTCNHCPYSIAYEDRINALDKEYKKKGYPVIAINPNDPAVVPDDSYEAMKVRSKEKKFSFPYLFDEGQKVYPLFGATKTPHCYIVQKGSKGEMKLVYVGAFDDSKDPSKVKESYLANALNDLLSGKQPSVNQTKAFGCSIKVAK